MTRAWEWDETLYAGSARHYGVGRLPYPRSLAIAVRDALGLDGAGRLLDVGCGPGSLTLLLAPLFAATVGVDADAGMVDEARRRATAAGLGCDGPGGVTWRRMRAEELPADLGTFRVVSFAQSFHWMDRPLVARRVRGMIDPGGAWVHVSATTHRGLDDADGADGAGADGGLPYPRPPWDLVADLVAAYLGPVRRAGRGTLPGGTRAGEEDVMLAEGFTGPQRHVADPGRVVHRDLDELVSAVFSLSGSTPYLFGDRRAAFEVDLRRLLAAASPDGRFAERTRAIEVVIWRP